MSSTSTVAVARRRRAHSDSVSVSTPRDFDNFVSTPDSTAADLRTLLSCTTTDPFDTLPVKPNHAIWKLLNSWLTAGNSNDHAEDGYRMQVAVIRKSWFWPMVNRNKATFNAAGRSWPPPW